ncbi:AtpZ/AtpI family protein [Patiriisocius hiemis]|uniref:AtpZ/AtpI family protein n=1 Tax=Patiriisocius hiemis TaxID=3075604 RepID=A0ABU2YBH4_9FLAO|nr:AtpZ/AtpI family protein [Constantimarinum sp. W242]MDT0555547.1 AtpZ/AtpI family protein [Constantimarinum sp. W242]
MSQKGNNGLKKWAILTAIGLEMGAIIFLFVKLGLWLDENYNSGEKLYIIFGTLLGVAISLFLVIKQTNKLNQ